MGGDVLSMMDDRMSSPERWAAAYIVRKMPVFESRRQKKERAPYSNNGEEGEAGRDGRFTALQQGSARLQSVLAGQIELISATGIFRPPPPFPPHLS